MKRMAFISIIICGIAISVYAQQPNEERVAIANAATAMDAKAAPALEGRLLTQVLNGSDDSPVTNVKIAVKNITGNFYTYVSGWATFYDASANRVATGTADFVDGSYAVELPVNGNYFGRAENTIYGGFADQLYNGFDCTHCDVTTGTKINVRDGSPISNVDFPLNSNAALISGRVLDARNGSPIPFAVVLIYAAGERGP